MQVILDLVRNDGVFNVTTCLAFMVLSSGSSAIEPLLICLLFVKGELIIMWFPVVTASGMV